MCVNRYIPVIKIHENLVGPTEYGYSQNSEHSQFVR